MYGLKINKELTLSVVKQLQDQLRIAILKGMLKAGDRLPPTRSLAKDLQIARNTVIQAYEQLIAEGYLVSIEGSGTYVDDIGKLPEINKTMSVPFLKEKVKKQDVISFNAGNPDMVVFPRTKWAKLLKEACLHTESDSNIFDNYAGYQKLRQEISSYVYRVKGILCNYNQIVIVPGASGAIDILAKLFKGKHNKVVLEDPCINFVQNIFSHHGYEIDPVEVDAHGMDVTQLKKGAGIDLIYVVPSHQYPIGGILPAARRISLIQYAREMNAYIIEDDYDSEFRYKGEALQALRNLDSERVIYIGSFSKIFSPSLRLGYMILPENLYGGVVSQMELLNNWVNLTCQLAMAEFIKQKYLDKHIYQMKKLYEKKRKYLMKCLTDTFGDKIKISGEYAGLHLLVSFNRKFSDRDVQKFVEYGLEIDLVEDYAIIKGKHSNELVLGYGGLSMSQIEEGIRRMRNALEVS